MQIGMINVINAYYKTSEQPPKKTDSPISLNNKSRNADITSFTSRVQGPFSDPNSKALPPETDLGVFGGLKNLFGIKPKGPETKSYIGTDFSYQDINGDLSYNDFSECDFSDTKFGKTATTEGSRFYYADFCGADLSKLKASDLETSEFLKTKYDRRTKFPKGYHPERESSGYKEEGTTIPIPAWIKVD